MNTKTTTTNKSSTNKTKIKLTVTPSNSNKADVHRVIQNSTANNMTPQSVTLTETPTNTRKTDTPTNTRIRKTYTNQSRPTKKLNPNKYNNPNHSKLSQINLENIKRITLMREILTSVNKEVEANRIVLSTDILNHENEAVIVAEANAVIEAVVNIVVHLEVLEEPHVVASQD